MRLRVIAGALGGRYIEAPPGRRTRPTPERVREAWMSALGERLRAASVLDLFAGSGALGIEALSRGAARAHFVESDGRALGVLRANLEELGLGDRASTARENAFAFLERTRGEPAWDLCLADPPYRSGAAARLARMFREEPFARVLCVEHAPAELEHETPAWRRAYGDTELSFLSAEEHEE